MRKIISENLKKEIIDYYLHNKIPLKLLSTKYNLSAPVICKILKDCPKYTKAELNNPKLQENYFEEIDSELKAYFIGLLIADGNVYHYSDESNRQDSISITLLECDSYILEKFRQELNANTNITKDTRHINVACTIAIRSNKIAKDLAKYGIVPNKTSQTYLPKIDEKYLPAVLRGILDSDGSIRWAKWRNKHLHYIGYCGTHKLMQDIVDYLIKINLPLKTIPKVYDYKGKALSEIKFASYDDIILFGDLVYKNASIYLKRKKDKYDKIKMHYMKETGII